MKRRDFLRYGAMGMAAAIVPGSRVTSASARTEQSGEIVSCAIYPSIGVARVGNSPTEYFLGVEVPGTYPQAQGGFKDAAGRLKRQAARFRIYGLDAQGNVVRELTGAEAEITWTVHLANTKAAWYNFDVALDIPGAKGDPPAVGFPPGAPIVSTRRNANFYGADRGSLAIDPGPRSIAGGGINAAGTDQRFAFDSGRFFERAVPLGELRTDAAGRLLVLGGFGSSASALPGLQANTFANNDLWHDDISDGPVDATVKLGGRALPVSGAWVVVGPPDYGPGIQSVVTMYDVIFEAATKLEPERRPERPSFTRQIYPLFARHVANQWVNAGFAAAFGWGSAGDFTTPEALARLADPSAAGRFLRNEVLQRFRNPAFLTMEDNKLPPYYGDGITLPAENPRQWMAVLPLQYEWLQQWAAGDFDADWPAGGLSFPTLLEDLPVEEQPAALDRAVLDECLGGPFHPGCEMTWPMRLPSLYEAPFRLRRRSGPEPDWGDAMTSTIALGDGGPLSASGPGDISRWMAVPWQTDTSSCLSAYVSGIDTYLPTFWPARVPNDVLSMQDYQAIISPATSPEQKRVAFAERVKWLRGLPAARERGLVIPFINTFVKEWSKQGVITRQPGPGDGSFPDNLWVETGFAGDDA